MKINKLLTTFEISVKLRIFSKINLIYRVNDTIIHVSLEKDLGFL